MIKTALFVVTLAACGGGEGFDDPHATSTCDDTTGFEGLACEIACDTDVSTSSDTCEATVVFGNAEPADVTCDETFEFDGIRGCCVLDDNAVGNSVFLHFAECE